jgi:hypothetical protein
MPGSLTGSPRRLPARVRILLALVAVLVLHGALSAEMEAARVRILCAVPVVVGPGGILADDVHAVPPSELWGRVEAWKAGRTKLLAAEGRVAVPVLFFRPADRIAIIGAGRGSGVSVGDPVEVPAGVLGFIEAVEPHLSRVRLLSASRSRIPVTLAESRRGLPGELSSLNAVLEGTGEGGRLVSGSLLSEFREGDRLNTSVDARDRKAASRSLAVGVVTAGGPDPRVRLFAGPGDLGLVTVAAEAAPAGRLFDDTRVSVRAAPLVASAGALLSGPGAGGVAAGCAVHSNGRYLGKVALATAEGFVASRFVDPGHRLFVRCLAAGNATFTGELVALGAGRCRLEGGSAGAGVNAALAVTAGGQDLIPADLAVGFLEREGEEWVIRDAAAPWPREAMVSVFTFGDELAKLVAR